MLVQEVISDVPQRVVLPLETRLVTIRPDLEACRNIVIHAYRRLSSGHPSAEAVYHEFYPRPFESPDVLGTTLLTYDGRPAGTMRLNRVHEAGFCRNGADVSVGLLDLLKADRPWEDILGCTIPAFSEISRFAMSDSFLHGEYTSGFKLPAFKMLFDATYGFAKELGYKSVGAIMPRYVRSMLDECGIGYETVRGVQLAYDHSGASSIFQKYNIYWQPGRPERAPKFCIFD